MQKPSEFTGILPILRGFHMTKALLHYIWKFVKHTGLADALTEREVYSRLILIWKTQVWMNERDERFEQ